MTVIRPTTYRRAVESKARPWVPASVVASATLPSLMRVDDLFQPITDQGSVGNGECAPSAIAELYEAMCARAGIKLNGRVSRLFPYYNARRAMVPSEINQDNGAANEQLIDAIIEYGVCMENMYGFNGSNIHNAPSAAAYTDAVFRRAVGYRSLHSSWMPDGFTRDIMPMKQALVNREPFVTGLVDYVNLKCSHATTLDIPPTGYKLTAAHAVVVSGYDDSHLNPVQGEWPSSIGAFWFRNSWGSGWGIGGCGWMPYDFMRRSALTFDQTTLAVNFSTVGNPNVR